MAAMHSIAMIFWQTPYDAGVARDVHWIMIAEVVLAGMLILLLLGALIAGLVIWGKVNRLIEDAKKAATPAIAKGTELFNDLAPKVRSITSNVEQISFTARAKVDEISETVSQINKTVVDINSKTQVQAARVNGMVSDALDTTHHVSQSIQHGIRVPIQKIAGLIAGLKTGFGHLIERSPFAQHLHKQNQTGPYDL
jgi:methyl-accepting chemotaxis protein